MFRRDTTTGTTSQDPVTHMEASGRVRRRMNLPARDEPQKGRLLSLLQQRDRQGTLGRRRGEEPPPRLEEREAYTPPETLPSERGPSRGKRIAWSLGALTAVGGAGAYLYRRRQNRRHQRW